MPDAETNIYQPGKDTRPLLPSELSPFEVQVIREIERRVSDARTVGRSSIRDRRDDHFAQSESRHRRVLLLDGGRGTGKTSILVTLVQRWNFSGSTEYDRILGPQPDFIRVLPILDFDPLPPGMPLAAGIIQAWRPLVNHLTVMSRNLTNWTEDESDTLADRWHKLFRVAAVGWAQISQETGLIEQVLDREEQVGDWQHLNRQWFDFVEDVIEFGTNRLPNAAKPLPRSPVFVIMIDDVDLQVGRISELLPALRLLYHPSVIFVVAAHSEHLTDMLKLDFLGRQHELARSTGYRENRLWAVADADRWSNNLALSAFEKVFPPRDQWQLKPLSLSAFLEFPGPLTFREVLNGRGGPLQTSQPAEPEHNDELLGDYVLSFAKLREKHEPGMTTVMTYRKAQQLADEIFTAADPRGVTNATKLLRRLLDPFSSSEADQFPGIDECPVVEIHAVGEVAALFSPELFVEVYPKRQEIVLSGRARFRFRAEGDIRVADEGRVQETKTIETASLLAISLQDSKRRVVAPGLKWEGRLSLAWTRWVMTDHAVDAAFRWLLHVLPTPLRLLEWSSQWAAFIRELASEARDRRDRIAYGWIYYQLLWLGTSLIGISEPKGANLEDEDVWNSLLAKEPPSDTDPKLGEERWRRRTLPLLARPEIGLTPQVQERLLAVSLAQPSKELIAERRRLVRDAFDAVAAERGEGPSGGMEEEARVEAVLSAIDRQYEGAPWYRFINKLRESELLG